MASSGTLTGSFNGTDGRIFTLYCYWSITAQSAANRTSTVQLTWAVRKSSTQWQTYKANAPWSQSVDGASTSGVVNFDIRNVGANVDYIYRTDTVVIQHNADGTKTATISGVLDLSNTSAGVGSLSGSIVLDAIHVNPPVVNTLTVSDVGTGQSTVGAYVATKSIIKLTATATAVESGATIANYAFYANDTLLQSGSSSTYTAPSAAVAGAYIFKCIVTDSYGLTGEKSTSIYNVQAYSLPTITSTETFRSNAGGTYDADGVYVAVKAAWSCAAVGTNAATCRASVGSSSANLSQNTTSVIGGSLSPTTAYQITYSVTDSFGGQATKIDTIYSAFKNLNLFPDNVQGGFAFGEAAELGKGKFNVPYSLFRGDVELTGGLTLGTALPIASGGTGAATAANARTALGTNSAELTNGSIDPAEYSLLVVWLNDNGISDHNISVAIPCVAGTTFVVPYNTYNSSYIYIRAVELYLNNGTLSVTGCYGTNRSWTRATISNPSIEAIYGIR